MAVRAFYDGEDGKWFQLDPAFDEWWLGEDEKDARDTRRVSRSSIVTEACLREMYPDGYLVYP